MDTAQPVFFDEAGQTGPNLLDNEQPYFVYASIALSHDECDVLLKEFRIRAATKRDVREIKGRGTSRTPRGSAAATWLLDSLADNVIVSIFHKKFALACKMYEYAFEPIVSNCNSLYYSIEFNRFIAGLIYLHILSGSPISNDILANFSRSLRTSDLGLMDDVYKLSADPSMLPQMRSMLLFLEINRDKVAAEFQSIETSFGRPFWALDLSDGAVFNLLQHWGSRHQSIDAFCDETKMLRVNDMLFHNTVNRTDTKPGGYQLFSLARPPQLVRSQDYSGVQLADIIASTTLLALTQKMDPQRCTGWMQQLGERVTTASVLPPGIDDLDARTLRNRLGSIVMEELLARACAGRGVCDDMGSFVAAALRTMDTRSVR